jgi:hypothetical protein
VYLSSVYSYGSTLMLFCSVHERCPASSQLRSV